MVNYPLQVQLLISLHQHNHPTILTIFQGHLSHLIFLKGFRYSIKATPNILCGLHTKMYFIEATHQQTPFQLEEFCAEFANGRVSPCANGQCTWVFVWFMYRATAKAKGSCLKKKVFLLQLKSKYFFLVY